MCNKYQITRAGLYSVYMPDITASPLDVAARITNSARDIPFSYSMINPYIRTRNESASPQVQQEVRHDEVPTLLKEFSSLNKSSEGRLSHNRTLNNSFILRIHTT